MATQDIIIDGGNAYRLGEEGDLEGAAVLVDGTVDDDWYLVDLNFTVEPADVPRVTAIFDRLRNAQKEG